jgi:MscS family membrane protein
MLGFIRAAQDEKLDLASSYFQKSPRRYSEAEEGEFAEKLLTILNQKFGTMLDVVSRDPQGKLGDGLHPNQERIGEVKSGGETFRLTLVQVQDKEYGKVWLISQDSLSRVTPFYASLQFSQIESRLPDFLISVRLVSMPLWQWVAIVLLAPLTFGLAHIVVVGVRWLSRIGKSQDETARKRPLRSISPVTVLLAICLHYAAVSALGTSLLYRQYYKLVVAVIIVIALYWAMTSLGRIFADRIGKYLESRGKVAERSLLLLMQRLFEVLLFMAFALLVLKLMGVNLTTALAGIGIGGIAIGLGAQKTFENIFGGVSVLTDKVFQVGDFCRIGDVVGTVEDIGLRSTQVRKVDRTLVSLPNGSVAAATLENLSQRDKILFQQTVGVRYDTSADQLRFLLAEIRAMLYQHPRVETSTARVRLVRFAGSSIDLDVFAYVITKDYAIFLAVQEDLMLRVMDLVEKAGAGFAFPTQTLYLGRETGTDEQKARTAEETVRQWREKNELPFPDHDPKVIERIQNRIEYPPPESSLRKPQIDSQ